MTQSQIVEVSRSRLAKSFLMALLGSFLFVAVVLGAIYSLVNFPVAAEKILHVQPAIPGILEASPTALGVNVWLTQEIFTRLAAESNEAITVFISMNDQLGYRTEQMGISFGYREGIPPILYDPSGTLEVREGLLIIPVQRNTPGVVLLLVLGVVIFAVASWFAGSRWHTWRMQYRQRQTY